MDGLFCLEWLGWFLARCGRQGYVGRLAGWVLTRSWSRHKVFVYTFPWCFFPLLALLVSNFPRLSLLKILESKTSFAYRPRSLAHRRVGTHRPTRRAPHSPPSHEHGAHCDVEYSCGPDSGTE